MAKQTNGIMGAFSGLVGTVVGSTWKGIPIMRSRPKSRTGPISEKEKANREKFAVAQFWLKPLLDFVRVGFKNYSPTVVGFGAAKSWMMKNAMEKTAEGFIIDPSRMLVSFGDLPSPANIRLGEMEASKLTVYWDVVEKDYAHMYDQCMLLAYDIEKERAIMKLTGQFKHVGSDTLDHLEKGRPYHIYVAFIAADRSVVSDSVYLGKVKT